MKSHESYDDQDVVETKIFDKDEVSKPRINWVKVIGLVFLSIVVFVTGLGAGIYYYIKTRPVPSPMIEEDYLGRINFLVLGIDGGVNGTVSQVLNTGDRSDVVMVVSLDPETKDVGVMSIPRDTRVFISQIEAFEKMGHAHAYGGPELSIKAVEEFLKIDIHHYVRFDFTGFKQVINRLGGIEMDVPRKMDYEDPEQDLYIHLKPGPQTLDGEKALQFVRYRQYVMGDIERVEAQKLFLDAVIDKAFRFSTIWKIPDLVRDVLSYVKTDVSYQDALCYAEIALGIKPENVKISHVPGKFLDLNEKDGRIVSYWVADAQQTNKLVDELIRGIDPVKNANIRVIIENGSGITGAADYLASILRDQGFSVTALENPAQINQEETKVLCLEDKKESQALVLRSVRSICDEAKAYVVEELETETEADVVVVIGKDFKRLTVVRDI